MGQRLWNGRKSGIIGFQNDDLDKEMVGPAGFTLDRARQSKFFGIDG